MWLEMRRDKRRIPNFSLLDNSSTCDRICTEGPNSNSSYSTTEKNNGGSIFSDKLIELTDSQGDCNSKRTGGEYLQGGAGAEQWVDKSYNGICENK